MHMQPTNVLDDRSSEDRLRHSNRFAAPHAIIAGSHPPLPEIQQANSTGTFCPTTYLSTSNRVLSTSTPQESQAQDTHQALSSLLAASTVGCPVIKFPSSSMTNPTTFDNTSHSPAAPSATTLQHDTNPGIHSEQGAADCVLPSLPAIRVKTAAPVSRTSSGIKECRHCGKTEEKQWRRYTTVPQEDMQPLCNRCFMWRRNRGGSASFRQNLLPSADILLASSNPRCRAASRGLFHQDSSSKKPGIISGRSRLYSGDGSTVGSFQGLDLAPATPDFPQSMMPASMQFNSTAAAAPDAGTGAALAGVAAMTWQSHWETYRGTAVYGNSSDWLGTCLQVPGQHFNHLDQTFLQPPSSAVATRVVVPFPATAAGTTTVSLPPVATNSSPCRQSLMKTHLPDLGVRKSLSKSPLNRHTARRAILSSYPGTPTTYQDSSEEDLWGLQARQSLSCTGGGSSGGWAPAGLMSALSAGLAADRCSSVIKDCDITQPAKVLAELVLLQSVPSNAAQDVSGCCMQAAQQGLSVGTEELGAADGPGPSDSWTQLPEIMPLDTGILPPETPIYATVGTGGAHGLSSTDMAALLQGVGGLHAANCTTATNSTEHGASHTEDVGNRAPGVMSALAGAGAEAERSSGGAQTLASALGQNVCNALSVATAGCLAAAAGVSNVDLPVPPEVLQVFIAAILTGIPVKMTDLSSKQDNYGAMLQQLESSPKLLKMLHMIRAEQ